MVRLDVVVLELTGSVQIDCTQLNKFKHFYSIVTLLHILSQKRTKICTAFIMRSELRLTARWTTYSGSGLFLIITKNHFLLDTDASSRMLSTTRRYSDFILTPRNSLTKLFSWNTCTVGEPVTPAASAIPTSLVMSIST